MTMAARSTFDRRRLGAAPRLPCSIGHIEADIRRISMNEHLNYRPEIKKTAWATLARAVLAKLG